MRLDDRQLRQISDELRPRASQVVRKTAFGIERRTKAAMSGPKSGMLYARGSRLHQASAPGEAPAVDYGVLANSIQVTADPGGLTAFVHTNTEYAPMLEFGSLRVLPRPFLGPATDAERPGFEAEMEAIVKP